jgi:hypothetical protein
MDSAAFFIVSQQIVEYAGTLAQALQLLVEWI